MTEDTSELSLGRQKFRNSIDLSYSPHIMTDKKYDVFGVGNAIVDTLAQVEDQFIDDLQLGKGGMALMDTQHQAKVLSGLEHHNLQLASGGSAANTMVAIAQSGGTGVYCGKVAHDTNGEFYKSDMEESGISFPVAMAPETGLPTGTCVVLTTPDAERTMCTHLGVSTTLTKSEINPELLAQSKCSYIEGYLWDAEGPRAACVEAFEQSKRLGVRAAFTFSDAFLIGRFAEDFHNVVSQYCDIVFCNADEARQFFESENLDECTSKMAEICDLAFITDSSAGCYVVEKGNVIQVPGFPVKAVDTVGAGDAFAGGALFGITNGMSAAHAAKWGNYFASRVVENIGPRIEGSMKEHLASILD
ncbi:MAG: adenosine kinase [Mariniblastus sp.]|nr:adenosine kinase [Mariniblastus sp.]